MESATVHAPSALYVLAHASEWTRSHALEGEPA